MVRHTHIKVYSGIVAGIVFTHINLLDIGKSMIVKHLNVDVNFTRTGYGEANTSHNACIKTIVSNRIELIIMLSQHLMAFRLQDGNRSALTSG